MISVLVIDILLALAVLLVLARRTARQAAA
jgi:hypothetical protein